MVSNQSPVALDVLRVVVWALWSGRSGEVSVAPFRVGVAAAVEEGELEREYCIVSAGVLLDCW